MRIANPIYDTAFKYLMEDLDIAKDLIGKIIDEEITELIIRPQEYSSKLDSHSILILRLDFKATIKLQNGSYKTVLIELQKAKVYDDLIRFRRYLGDNYRKKDQIRTLSGTLQEVPLPIITIYFLGFPLPEIETSVLKVSRIYEDLISGKQLFVKTDFVEKLTHDSFIIQILALPPKERTELEGILQVFNQTYVLMEDKRLLQIAENVLPNNNLSKRIADRLRRAATDESVLRGMDIEDEYESTLDGFVRKLHEKEEALQQKNEVLQQKEATISAQTQALNEKDAALAAQQQLIEALKKQLGK